MSLLYKATSACNKKAKWGEGLAGLRLQFPIHYCIITVSGPLKTCK